MHVSRGCWTGWRCLPGPWAPVRYADLVAQGELDRESLVRPNELTVNNSGEGVRGVALRLRVTDVVWDHIWVTFQLTFEGTDDEPFCEGRVSEHVPEMMLLDGVAEDGAEGDGQLATYEPDAGVSEGETTEAEAEGVIEVPSGDEVQSRDQVVPTAAEAEAGAVEFVFVDKKRLLPADATHLGGRDYRIRINITNFSGRKQFPDGTWRIMPRIDERRGPGATFDLNRASDLPDLSRVFMYDGNKTATPSPSGSPRPRIRPFSSCAFTSCSGGRRRARSPDPSGGHGRTRSVSAIG